MDKKDIVVVVPIYLPALSEMEAVSLKQCLDILSDYSIVIIKPENLDISNIQSQFLLPKVCLSRPKSSLSLQRKTEKTGKTSGMKCGIKINKSLKHSLFL